MPYAGGDLQFVVEIQINGTWVTITSRARSAGGLRVKHGRSDGAIQAETSRCAITIGNDDGWLTEENPMSPWYPHIGRGTAIRVLLAGVLVAGSAALFTGEIDTIRAEHPSANQCVVKVDAIGQLGVVAQDNDPLRSPMYRSVTGATPGGFVPHAYWSMVHVEGMTQIEWSLPGVGPPMTLRQGVGAPGSVSANATLLGSDPVLTFNGDIVALGTIPPYVDAGVWVLQVAVDITDDSIVLGVETASPSDPFVDVKLTPSANELRLRVFRAGSFTYSTTVALDGAAALADWVSVTVMSQADSSGSTDRMTATARNPDGTVLGTATMLVGTDTHAVVRVPNVPGVHLGTVSAGHLALYIDPAFVLGVDDVPHARAMHGWSGELTTARLSRLLTEEGKSAVIIGTSTTRMGPQRLASLHDLLLDIERADQGLIFDAVDTSAICFRTREDLYNQAPRVSIKRGSFTSDLKPIWDFQRTRNDWTVSRVGGSSARVSDEEHVAAKRRRIKDSATVNLETDDVLADHASFRVAIGTAAGPRYSEGGINLRNNDGALLADDVLGLIPGDRLIAAAAALPSQHPPGGLDQMVLGWDSELDSVLWLVYPNMVPSEPFNVIGPWDTEVSVLHAAIDSDDTSADIATTSGPLWTTTDVGSGIDLNIEGEQVRATAIAVSAATFGAVGTVAHANNANVTPGIPASVATGNLLLCFAAIRNSGAGVPNTPAGYARLPVFPASSNVQLFAKIATSAGEVAPTISFTGGVANADTSAQMIRLAGKWHDVNNVLLASASCLNASAQNITYPGLPKPEADDCFILYLGWKQDDWTSVSGPPGTEIGEPSTALGDDQGIVWNRQNQSTATTIPSGVFTVTGGVGAISRGAVLALRPDYQTATIVRSLNGVVASHAAGADVKLWQPMRWAL